MLDTVMLKIVWVVAINGSEWSRQGRKLENDRDRHGRWGWGGWGGSLDRVKIKGENRDTCSKYIFK
jgi:hypothetical protein